jgi:hypothetical protein
MPEVGGSVEFCGMGCCDSSTGLEGITWISDNSSKAKQNGCLNDRGFHEKHYQFAIDLDGTAQAFTIQSAVGFQARNLPIEIVADVRVLHEQNHGHQPFPPLYGVHHARR